MMIRMVSYTAIFLFFSCNHKEKNKLPSSEGVPDQESWGVTIILTREGLMKAKVSSGHLEKYNEREYIFLDNNVVVDFFDLQEKHTSTLLSD